MREFYERGDLPVSVERPSTHPSGGSLVWEVEPNLLDYETYLPMFLGGLLEVEEPYALFARRGILDMLQHGDDSSVAEAVPLLIAPLRAALLTGDAAICVTTVESLQAILRVGEKSAQAMLPFLKSILPCLRRLLLNQKWAPHDDNALDSCKRGTVDLHSMIEETLQLLDRYGGKDAHKAIKALVPMYEGR